MCNDFILLFEFYQVGSCMGFLMLQIPTQNTVQSISNYIRLLADFHRVGISGLLIMTFAG
jgi:hypothetical protein